MRLPFRRRPDPLGRAGVLAIAGVRAAIGVAALVATRPALRRLGFDRPAPSTVAVARLAGGRDLALGLHAFAVADDARALREAALLSAGVDAGDALAFTALGAEGEAKAALMNAPLALSAAIAGIWLGERLR